MMPQSPDLGSFALPLAPALAALCSTLASLVLLLWIQRLGSSLRGRLIARQLWHLALSDVFASALLLPWYALATWKRAYPDFDADIQTFLNTTCLVCHGNNIPYMTSVFTELHIAVAAIATILRYPGVLRVLSRTLPFVWVLGFVFGAAVEVLGRAHWDSDSGGCTPRSLGEQLKAGTMTLVLVICVAIYCCGMVLSARRHGGSVEGRAWRRASIFIVAAVVTWVPFVLFSFRPSNHTGELYSSKSGPLYFVMSVFLELNGLINTLVYAWQSGFLRKTERRAEYFANAQETASHLPVGASFNVAFTSDVSVLMVSGLTGVANQTADEEVAALESPGSGASSALPAY